MDKESVHEVGAAECTIGKRSAKAWTSASREVKCHAHTTNATASGKSGWHARASVVTEDFGFLRQKLQSPTVLEIVTAPTFYCKTFHIF